MSNETELDLDAIEARLAERQWFGGSRAEAEAVVAEVRSCRAERDRALARIDEIRALCNSTRYSMFIAPGSGYNPDELDVVVCDDVRGILDDPAEGGGE